MKNRGAEGSPLRDPSLESPQSRAHMKKSSSLRDILNWLLVGIGVLMVLYHMVSSQYLIAGAYEHQAIHLMFIFMIIFFKRVLDSDSIPARISYGVFAVLGVFTMLYVILNMRHLEEVIGYPDTIDVVVGVLIVLLVFEGTRLAWGMTLPIVAGFFVAYFFFGHLLPGPLGHRLFKFDYIISYLSIGLSGVFGTFLSISANQVFLFVVFGSLLGVIKINEFFYELGKLAGRHLQGGPGHTAVISSSLVGMVSGAPVANVAITGSFTIPYMKRVGYTAEQAGAIEATASTGGQIMPPVLGAAAFLMASFLGVSYTNVMTASILPAIFFYLSVAAGVQFLAVSQKLSVPKERVDYRIIWRRMALFLIPVGVIFLLLIIRYSPMVAGFWAILVAIFMSYLFKDTRPTLPELAKNLSGGAIVGAQIGISLALVGIMAQSLITTGMGSKIAGLVHSISGGNLFIALVLTMVVSLILGCGVPPAAAYSLVAIVAIPSIVQLGVEPMSAHFFSFYFAIISAITPPVALAALAGSGIAKGNYMKTGLVAFKLALSGFIIPYLIVFNPILVLHVESKIWAVGSLIAIPIALITLTAFVWNCGLVRFTKMERLVCVLSSSSMFGYCIFRHVETIPLEYPCLIAGFLLFFILLWTQIKRKRAIGLSNEGVLNVAS